MIRHNYTQAEINFFRWLEENAPTLSYYVASQMSEMPGLGQVDTQSGAPSQTDSGVKTVWDVVTDGINNLAATGSNLIEKVGLPYLQYQQQKDLIKLNMELARQGKELVNADQFALQGRAGLTPDTQTTLIQMGLIVAAALIIPALLKGKK